MKKATVNSHVEAGCDAQGSRGQGSGPINQGPAAALRPLSWCIGPGPEESTREKGPDYIEEALAPGY